jgi:hypothetical protein
LVAGPRVRLKPDTTEERALGGVEHLRRLYGRQAAEVARLADALIARPARQPVNFDEL